MSRWFKFWTSSQPTIKQEAVESDASEHEVKDTKEGDMDVDMDMDVGLEEMIAIAQQEQEQREGKGEQEKRGGKKGRKGRKSRDLVEEPENEGQKLGGEGVNQSDDEEVPQLVEVIEEDIETSFGFTRKGRPSGSTTKRKRKSIEDDAPFRPGGVVPEAEEPPTLNEIKSANNKGRNTRSSKSRSELVEEDTDEDEPAQLKGMNDPPQEQVTQHSEPEHGEEYIPEILSDLSKKLRRAKKNATVFPRQTVQVVIEPAVAHNDDPAAGLHKPLTPAHVERNRSHSTSHEEPPSNNTKDAQLGASTEPEEEAEMIPKKPSKKALGKRKASDIDVSTSTSKKRKTQKDKAAGTPELASFGFISDPERRPTPIFTPINAPRASVLPLSGQRSNPPVEPLADVDSDENIFVPEVPVLKSSERKKKRRLPVGDDAPNPQTPQNKGSRKSKTPKSPKSATKTPQAKTPATSRTGKLTNEQFEAILAAVEGFREENNLTEFGINEIIQKDAKADTVGLWKRIHDAVPDAPRRSVQSMCRRKFHNFEARGQWTEEQDQELRDAYEKYPAKWKQIGEALNRFHEDCRDRWRNYGICGDNMRKDAWDKEEEERLREVVQGCIESIREMKRVSTDANDKAKSDESLVDWNVVSQNMDRTRSRLQCLQKWKKMKEREEVVINDPVLAKPISETWRGAEAEDVARKMTPKEKLLLLYAVRETGAGREGKIPWIRVQEEVPGQPRKMTMKVAFREMRQHIEDNQEMALQDIVDLLVDAYEASVPSEPVGFNDDFELFRSSQKLLSNKKKRKSRPKGAAEAEVQSSSDDNGEGPSTISKPKRQKTRLSEKFVVDNDEDADDIYAVPRDEPRTKSKRRRTTSSPPAEETQVSNSATKSKRKLRDRMKSIGQSQSQSQERDDQRHSELSDVHTALESLKTGTSRARRAAAIEAAKSKGKQVLSEERVVQSDEEEQPPVEDTPAKRPAKVKRKRVSGKPFPSEGRVVENGDEEAPSRKEEQSEHEDMELDEEDPVDAEEPSVHEDEPIANGASAEDDEQQSANETDPEVNEELSRNESEPSAYQEIEVNKDDTLISPDPSEADEEEPSLAEETRSEKEEKLPANQILEDNDDAMDMDNDDITYTAPGGPEAEDGDSLLEDDEDKPAETDQESVGLDEYEDEEENTHHDQESVDLDAARDASANEDMEVDEEQPSVAEGKPSTNGFHEEESSQNYGSDAETDFHGFQTEAGSVDLDTAVQTSHRHKSSSPAPSGEDKPRVNGLLNGLAKGYNYQEEEVSSDDDDMSDIPAKIIPKAKVAEAKREKKPKKDKKSKSKSKRISGFR